MTMKYAERAIKLNHSNDSSHQKSFLDRKNFVLSFPLSFFMNCMSKVVPQMKYFNCFSSEYNSSWFDMFSDCIMYCISRDIMNIIHFYLLNKSSELHVQFNKCLFVTQLHHDSWRKHYIDNHFTAAFLSALR